MSHHTPAKFTEVYHYLDIKIVIVITINHINETIIAISQLLHGTTSILRNKHVSILRTQTPPLELGRMSKFKFITQCSTYSTSHIITQCSTYSTSHSITQCSTYGTSHSITQRMCSTYSTSHSITQCSTYSTSHIITNECPGPQLGIGGSAFTQ